MRLTLALIVMVVAVIGGTFALILSGWSPFPRRAPVTQSAPAPVMAVGPTPGAIGSVGHLRSSIIWVDELGLASWTRAYGNRDQKGQDDAMRLFETVLVTDNPPVKITNRGRDSIQVEVMAGQHVGRRGWTDATGVLP